MGDAIVGFGNVVQRDEALIGVAKNLIVLAYTSAQKQLIILVSIGIKNGGSQKGSIILASNLWVKGRSIAVNRKSVLAGFFHSA